MTVESLVDSLLVATSQVTPLQDALRFSSSRFNLV